MRRLHIGLISCNRQCLNLCDIEVLCPDLANILSPKLTVLHKGLPPVIMKIKIPKYDVISRARAKKTKPDKDTKMRIVLWRLFLFDD